MLFRILLFSCYFSVALLNGMTAEQKHHDGESSMILPGAVHNYDSGYHIQMPDSPGHVRNQSTSFNVSENGVQSVRDVCVLLSIYKNIATHRNTHAKAYNKSLILTQALAHFKEILSDEVNEVIVAACQSDDHEKAHAAHNVVIKLYIFYFHLKYLRIFLTDQCLASYVEGQIALYSGDFLSIKIYGVKKCLWRSCRCTVVRPEMTTDYDAVDLYESHDLNDLEALTYIRVQLRQMACRPFCCCAIPVCCYSKNGCIKKACFALKKLFWR